MLKNAFGIILIGLVAIFFCDLQGNSGEPFIVLSRIGQGFISPNFSILPGLWRDLLNTVLFALYGTALAALIGACLSFFYENTFLRLFCAFLRSIHELFWVFLLLPIFGLSHLTAILAICLPNLGAFAKMYSEILQESDRRPLMGLPDNPPKISRFLYAVLPQILPELKSYTRYRFECALRSSAVIGFIGLPTAGLHLELYFSEAYYSEAAALMYFLFALIAGMKIWMHRKLLIPYLIGGLFLLDYHLNFSLENLRRFFYEVCPWPLRRQGFHDGCLSLNWDGPGLWNWFNDIIRFEALPGLWQTLLLALVSICLAFKFILVTFPLASKKFMLADGSVLNSVGQLKKLSWRSVAWSMKSFLLVLRATPEYVLAFILLLVFGASMLPAVLTVALHNGAIVAHLMASRADLLKYRLEDVKGRSNRYFYEVLPRLYGSLLSFLFYRFEVMMRESAILGILGIGSIGYFINFAISEDKLDKALFLILCSGLLNMITDSVCGVIRGRLKAGDAGAI